MQILVIPDYSQKNPYQRLLAQALVKHGVPVKLANTTGHFPLLNAIRHYGRPDLLHLHWTSQFWQHRWQLTSRMTGLRFLIEVLILKHLGIKIVWTVHNLHAHEQRNPRLEHRLNSLLCRFYDGMIVHCEAARQAVLQTYHLPKSIHPRMFIIPHGHFVDVYPNRIGRDTARRRLDLDDNAFVFLHFGQLRMYKGIFELMEAFLALGNSQARLLIAGQPANADIQAQLVGRNKQSERIKLKLEFVPDTDIQTYMNAANVVVLPFQNILTSSTVILAMSFGKPVIAPQLGCLVETLGDRGGIFYDPQKASGLPDALRDALIANLAEMGEQNLKRVRKFNWDEIGEATYRTYESCFQ